MELRNVMMKHPTNGNTIEDDRYTFLYILILFCIALAVMLKQFIASGYYSVITSDTFAYTSWAWQFTEALQEGINYPRWMPNDFWGYGSPTFILYSPLSFYLIAFLNIFSASIVVAMNFAKFFSLFLTGFGIFFLVKEFYPGKTAFCAAVFYILFPFNILQMYLFGSFATTISLLWYSPVFLFASRYFKYRQYKHLIYTGICYGGLILTHLIQAYMLSFVIAVFIIFMSAANKKRSDLLALPIIITIGILVSAAYLLPLFLESKFTNPNSFISKESGLLFSNFFLLPNLTSQLSPDMYWTFYYDTFALHFFLLVIITIWFASKVLIINKDRIVLDERKNTINRIFLSVAVWSLYLLFGASRVFWEIIPFFKYIQVPARWLNITVFSVTMLFASFVYVSEKTCASIKAYHYFIFVIYLTLISFDYYYINNAHIFTKDELLPVKSITWTKEHLPAGVEIAKLEQEKEDIRRAVIIKGEGKAEIVDWKSAVREVEIAAIKPLAIRIRTFNFPGWTAYIDGKRSEIATEEGTGTMLVNMPAGNHRLRLIFGDTPARYVGKIVSLSSLIFLSGVLLWQRKWH